MYKKITYFLHLLIYFTFHSFSWTFFLGPELQKPSSEQVESPDNGNAVWLKPNSIGNFSHYRKTAGFSDKLGDKGVALTKSTQLKKIQ